MYCLIGKGERKMFGDHVEMSVGCVCVHAHAYVCMLHGKCLSFQDSKFLGLELI